ncbi:MAG: AAA family ATPase, partial [Oscillospiraceae bacterium]|nr:AAA family ATPase [Oscillospiraceae bacterium]
SRLSASFGVLQNSRMKLEPGLIFITAPNERGKSTWCAFIRAMLYGINTSERNREGVLAEKTKYRPWDGAPMEGAMEIEIEGKALAIQRTALGSSPMKRLDVRYSGTGQEVLALMHENLGETLTGVPEAVFLRSAFIRQAGMKIGQTGELEQRIAALVTAGEEGVSYSDTAATLGTWLRRRRYNQTGQIPTLEAEIGALDQTLSRMQAASAVYNEVSLELDRAMTRAKELREEQDIHIEIERRRARKHIADARRQLEEIETEIKELREKLTHNGKLVTAAEITEARELYDKLTALNMRYNKSKTEREAADRDLSLVEEERNSGPFGGKDIEEAQAVVEAAAEDARLAQEANSFNKKAYTFPLAILPVLALGALTLTQVLELPLWPISVAAIAATIVFAVLFFQKWSVAKEAEKKRLLTFQGLKSTDMDDLNRRFEEYERLTLHAAEMGRQFNKANAVCTETMAEMESLKEGFETAVRSFAPGVEDLAEAHTIMTETSKAVDRLALVEHEREIATRQLETLTAAYEGDPYEPIPEDGLKTPVRSKSETAYEQKRMEKELDTLKHSHGRAQGEIRALGDPVVLGAKRSAMRERLIELLRQHDALQLAGEVLAEANDEMSARFSPLLGKQAGEYLDKLTDGAYKRVLVDKELTPSTERAGESIARDVLYLSGGTADQVYLALRLAICDLTFPVERACPIILDDALVSFDEIRLGGALRLLKELSAERQILLFSCHNREAGFFKDAKDVNLVNL